MDEKKNKFNYLKKNIKNFIKDENGFMDKAKILKIGLGTISALGIMSALSNSFAGHSSHPSHSNGFAATPVGSCVRLSHTNHPSHSVHSSY